ncbi:MAG: ATP-dependent Clp protease adaptor ClpS [Fimbriimonadaceae bacterium]|nr:ATP-dependent Clp protease adaptor ClpS [Fimbriimonadaceae bacterium]QYK55758.1 MAG: ATP-dependent Clp protease adaptor ClpS [Fimbriimonadaceae bacterium]
MPMGALHCTSAPILLPEPEQKTRYEGRYAVVIFNNDHTPYEAVVGILMAATACEREEAEIETWEAHTYGQAPVHFDTLPTCEEVAGVIKRIGVATEIRKEWDD